MRCHCNGAPSLLDYFQLQRMKDKPAKKKEKDKKKKEKEETKTPYNLIANT